MRAQVFSREAITALESDLDQFGRVGIRAVACDERTFSAPEVDVLFNSTDEGIVAFARATVVACTPIAKIGLSEAREGWKRILQGPFQGFDDAIDSVTRFLAVSDLAEPFDIERAWDEWGPMWCSQLRELVISRPSLMATTDRVGDKIRLVVILGEERLCALSIFDTVIGHRAESGRSLIIRRIASCERLFRDRLEHVIDECLGH